MKYFDAESAMDRRISFIFLLILFLFMGKFLLAQSPDKVSRDNDTLTHSELPFQGGFPQQQRSTTLQPGISKVFDEIEKGIVAGDVKKFSSYFARQVYVNLRGGESGYFSVNQTFYLLQNFFSVRRTIYFKFTTFGETENVPFATGGGASTIRGNRETFQVYIALARINARWKITQFNVY